MKSSDLLWQHSKGMQPREEEEEKKGVFGNLKRKIDHYKNLSKIRNLRYIQQNVRIL